MTVRFEEDGKTYEFRGEYRVPKEHDYYLSTSTHIAYVKSSLWPYPPNVEPRAILHLIPEVFEFGGVQFVKTGEVRFPHPGEWYLWSRGDEVYPCYSPDKSLSPNKYWYSPVEILQVYRKESSEPPEHKCICGPYKCTCQVQR